jgi:hypothetical protein
MLRRNISGFLRDISAMYLLNILLTFVVHRTCALFVIKVFFCLFFYRARVWQLFCLWCPFVFWRDVWIWFLIADVASRRSTNLVTHLPELATHLPDLANHLLGI